MGISKSLVCSNLIVPKSWASLDCYQKSDERILGDGDFVNTVLKAAQEELDKKYSLQASNKIAVGALPIC